MTQKLSPQYITDNFGNRVIIDAGAVYLNVEYDAATDSFLVDEKDALGVTSGTNEFLVEFEYRDIEANGVKGKFKGATVLESSRPQLKVNLKEVTARNLTLALPSSKLDTTTSSTYDIITSGGCIPKEAYIKSMALVGRVGASCDSGNGGKPIIVIIKNAINTESLSMQMNDRNEMVIPMLFEGTYEASNVINGTHPFEIYLPKEDVQTTPPVVEPEETP